MSELNQEWPIAIETDSFADYYHTISNTLASVVVAKRDVFRTAPLDLEALSDDISTQGERVFEDCDQRTSRAITKSLEHEVRFVGRLAQTQGDARLLRGGYGLHVIPPASSEPIGFSAQVIDGLYAVGANEQAVREISIQHLDDALVRGGMGWIAANLSALRAVRKVHKSAIYDPANVEYEDTVTEGKVIRELTDHHALVTPRDLRDTRSIACAYLGLVRTRSDSFVQS